MLTLICLAAIGLCASAAWRWGRLPLIADPDRAEFESRGAAALDALRVLAGVLAAATIAGGLAVGLGGRLVMRILAATSGSEAQGFQTDAGETVGEITVSGSVAFFLFAGLLVPLLSAFGYLLIRRWLPRRSWPAGLIFGTLLLGTVGVADPLSPDNVDFELLSPVPLAVGLVVATALLYGVTFTALAARLDTGLAPLNARGVAILERAPYLALVWLVLPPATALAALYVAVRTISRGRLTGVLARRRVAITGRALILVAVAIALLRTADAGMSIL